MFTSLREIRALLEGNCRYCGQEMLPDPKAAESGETEVGVCQNERCARKSMNARKAGEAARSFTSEKRPMFLKSEQPYKK